MHVAGNGSQSCTGSAASNSSVREEGRLLGQLVVQVRRWRQQQHHIKGQLCSKEMRRYSGRGESKVQDVRYAGRGVGSPTAMALPQ